MELNREVKLEIIKSIIWDYRTPAEDLLDVVEGLTPRNGAFDRDSLFIRSLEYLPWHYVIALWGVEAIKQLYTREVSNRIWPKEGREAFDVAIGILRG
jgi:hypothetical protein